MFEGPDKYYHMLKKITGITLTIAFIVSLLNLLATENYHLMKLESLAAKSVRV